MKKLICVILCIVMLMGYAAVPTYAANSDTYFISPEDFKDNLGSWSYRDSSESGKPFESLLLGRSDKAKNLLVPAGINFNVLSDGTYTVYVRTRDFATHPGTRQSQIAVNGHVFPHILGKHGVDGWSWENVGTVNLKKGTSTVQLVDITGYTPRIEGVIITSDDAVKLPDTASDFSKFKKKYAVEIIPGELVNPIYVEPEIETEFVDGKSYVAVDTSLFKQLGTWKVQEESGSLLKNILFSSTKSAVDSDNAKAVFGVANDGVYDIWIHTKDSTTNPGQRSFYFKVNDNEEILAGGHGQEGWHWDKITSVPLFAGEHTITLRDYRGNFSRVDMILITNDENIKIGENQSVMEKLQKEKLYKEGSVSPSKASDSGEARPEDDIAVQFNGKYMNFDVPPLIINSRTMVPMRAIFEALGCTVSWDGTTQTATGIRNGTAVSLTIGSDMGKVNGKGVALDAPAALINGRTMIPLRFVSEALGALVNWEAETSTVRILAKIPSVAYFLRPESFETLGTWFMEGGQADAFNGSALRGLVDAKDSQTQTKEEYDNPEPAVATIPISKSGDYRIWVHSKDFETNAPGTRYFNIAVNGEMCDKKFGAHGKNGYKWADAGVFKLNEGSNTISLLDTSKFYARCDGILIVEDLDYIPEESYAITCALATPYNPASNRSVEFPVWAKSNAQPEVSASIENSATRVIFYKVPTDNGTVVQNEIYSLHNGQWVLTKKRSEPLGYIMMQADDSVKTAGQFEIAGFKNTYTENGVKKSYIGEDVYKAGNAVWLIPNDFIVSDNKITLKYPENNYVDFTSLWELDTKHAPKVIFDANIKVAGAYSFGSFEGGGFKDYDFAMIPFRVMSKRVEEERGLTTQQFATTPMSTYTLAENNEYSSNKVTKGVVVDPAWIPVMWNYAENNKFGLASFDASGTYSGGVFAPLFGMDDCKFKSGDSYKFSYRVISEVSDWFDSYKRIATELFEFDDYRSNYYTSLNEAIYNTVDLMMEDDLSGWNDNAKAFYNMESSYMATNANPMALLQAYQLTENKELLEKRAIPTVANLLTRPNLHMNWTLNKPLFDWGSHEIGSPIKYYNLNVMGGVYEQMGGTLPWLLNYSLEKAEKGTVNETASAVAPFMNDLHLYKYTGDKNYLDKAIAAADEYLEKVVYAPKTVMPKDTVFIYSGYYPSLSSLLDIYDVTKEQRFLDAAEYTGRWISAMVQIAGVDSTKRNQIIHVNEPEDVAVRWQGGKGDHLSSTFWWHGDVIWRQGTTPGNPADTDKAYALMREHVEDVPLWVASNAGLGIEQVVTFNGSSYITMQCWAGDMVRLSHLTGEEYFETVARNAIVGRFGGYSGYYLQRFWTYYMQPEYGFNGPDFTNIYWHHIPQFYAMLCDFLINQITVKTDNNVMFPALRQQGYAYFDSNQYGYAPGKFYDEDGMWLWLAEDTVAPDSIQINWLAARKDGVMGIAFMNEDHVDTTTTITLGSKVPGGSDYTGSAVLYDENGDIGTVDVVNGVFTLTVPAKGFRAVKLNIPEVKAPGYASVNYNATAANVGATVSEHTNGKGYVLQMSPDKYFAYVYTTTNQQKIKSATLTYTVNDVTKTEIATVYPFEFIVQVDDPKAEFIYTLSETALDGTVTELGGGTLRAVE